MAAWSDLFGDELCTTSGGKQHPLPTDDHLAGKEHCLVVVAHEDCPNCPGFFAVLQNIKADLEAAAVGLVCVFQANNPEEHLRVAEKYGEVHIPTGFPSPPELLQKKRYLGEMIGKRVPSYAVFDASHGLVVDVTTNDVGPLRSFLQSLGGAEAHEPQAEAQDSCDGDGCQVDGEEDEGA